MKATGKRELFVTALGGLGEIGMNCLVVESEGRLLVVDCGVMFSSDGLGIDLVHPDFEYLIERRDDIEAVLLTHAHEDHIGAVPFLLRQIDVPVLGGAYSLSLLSEKLSEMETIPKLDSRRLDPGGQVELGPFHVETFFMPHSIIGNTGLVIDTSAGRILHTGDFKLGLNSPSRGADVLARLASAGDGRVDMMLCDSTGSEESREAGDEKEVFDSLVRIIDQTEGRVFVAVFSSNVERLASLVEAARVSGRKLVLCGRSVETHARVAEEIGALSIPRELCVSLDKALDLPRSRILAIVSGTQGEARSALGRLGSNNHHILSIDRGDTVVLSSRIIPGNEIAIGQVIDQLLRQGARVVHRAVEGGVHVSGHGSRNEIRMAVEAVAPRCFVPVHGTYRHLVAAADLARLAGAPDVIVAANGQKVGCSSSGFFLESRGVPTGRVSVDKGGVLPEPVLLERRLLGANGALVVFFGMDREGNVKGPVNVIARGVTREEELPFLSERIAAEVRRIVGRLDAEESRDIDKCQRACRSALRRFTSKLIFREPYVAVTVFRT